MHYEISELRSGLCRVWVGIYSHIGAFKAIIILDAAEWRIIYRDWRLVELKVKLVMAAEHLEGSRTFFDSVKRKEKWPSWAAS